MSLPQAARYERFRNSVLDVAHIAEPGPSWPEPLPELDLQSLWFAGEFGRQFTSACGKTIRIRDFGVWNHAAGPDFIQTSIAVDDNVLRGDIEIDPDVRDWERHGHGANPRYDRVVLHLFTRAPEAQVFTRDSHHREVLQVQLFPEMLAAHTTPRHQAEARLGRCATPFALMGTNAVQSLIEAAAQYRLHRKSEKLHALMQIHGRDQAIYQLLAGALGYRANQRAFTILAQRLPLKSLLKQSEEEREALLFGVSGFLEAIRYEDTTPETRSYLRQLWSSWWKRRDAYETWLELAQLPPWRRSSSRPGNHPQRRLGALASLIAHWKQITAPLRHADSWDTKSFGNALLGLAHPYWSHHYTLLSEPVSKPLALLGKTRVHEILANVAYPLLVPECPSLWDEYLKLPAVLDNHKVRRAVLRLFGEDPRAASFQKRLHQQQGLLQIYEDYCLEDDSACENCPFPERLTQWQ